MEVRTYNYKTLVASGMRMHPGILAILIILLLNIYCSSASVIVKSNNSFRCSGRLDECLLEEELDLELEFLMNPYMSRMLGSAKYKHPTPFVGEKAAIVCGQPGDPYDKCIEEIKHNNHLCVVKNIFAKCPP